MEELAPPPPLPDLAEPAPAPRGGELHAIPAPLWRRALATLIDATILGSVIAAYLYLAATVGGATRPSSIGGLDGIVDLLRAWSPILLPGAILALLLGAVYAAVFAILWGGRTPGRRLLGIRLVDATGLPPRPARAVVRAVLSLFSFAFLLAGFWLALVDRRGQTLHDKLTRTFVVRPTQAL